MRYTRGEEVAGSHIQVYVLEHEPDSPKIGLGSDGRYVAMGRPWSEWRLRRVRRAIDRKAARMQQRHDAAMRHMVEAGVLPVPDLPPLEDPRHGGLTPARSRGIRPGEDMGA